VRAERLGCRYTQARVLDGLGERRLRRSPFYAGWKEGNYAGKLLRPCALSEERAADRIRHRLGFGDEGVFPRDQTRDARGQHGVFASRGESTYHGGLLV
jgi:hypothetical protein